MIKVDKTVERGEVQYNAYSKKALKSASEIMKWGLVRNILWNNEKGFNIEYSSIDGFICGMVQLKQNWISMK